MNGACSDDSVASPQNGSAHSSLCSSAAPLVKSSTFSKKKKKKKKKKKRSEAKQIKNGTAQANTHAHNNTGSTSAMRYTACSTEKNITSSQKASVMHDVKCPLVKREGVPHTCSSYVRSKCTNTRQSICISVCSEMIRYLNFLLRSRTQWRSTRIEFSPRCVFVAARNTHGTKHIKGRTTEHVKGRTTEHVKGRATEHVKGRATESVTPNDSTQEKIILERNYDKIKYLKTQELRILSEICCRKNIRDVIIWSEISRNAIEKCNDFKYFDAVLLLSSFDKMNIVDKSLYKNFADIFIKQINYLEPRHLIISLNINDNLFYYVIDEKQQKELKLLTVQEIFDHLKNIKLLTFSWELYEKDLINEFLYRLDNFKNEIDVNQLDDPFICLNFLVTKNCVSKNFLLALSKWCANKVYEYPSRSTKRPLSFQLIKLYQLMKEKKVENLDFIEKAIYRFVISRGGLETNRDKMFKPVSYQKGRKYIFTRDPLAGTPDVLFSGSGGDARSESRGDVRSERSRDLRSESSHDLRSESNRDVRSESRDDLQEVGENLEQRETNITNAWESGIEYEDESSQEKLISGNYGLVRNISEKKRLVSLSLEKKTEKKKDTHSNSRYCNFKLRQRPKRIKNGPAEVTISK
ncbi:conserved Plasmodium protein, unknown function [Plasmodium ovale wallikeri]|uniref:Uncharacterized protein n=1 Tax=Plasmodium ovale wallikeri TaxID=864142 RepID=A0A1A8YPS9_PLAOA|nr:conserved Plasmodium protein, unknown function [Plasmodium ovale wallikeri]